jgi:hypothetical protein
MRAQQQPSETLCLATFRASIGQADELALAVVPGGFFRLFRPLPIVRGVLKRDTTELAKVVRLARETVPTILLINLVIVFEAYWEDLAIAILSAYPHLFLAAESSMGMGPPQRPLGAEERALRLFAGKYYHVVMQGLWDQGLSLPLSAICQAEGTTGQELDRAKEVRNLHIHNRGLVTQKYLNRTQDQAVSVGDPMPVTAEYAKEIKTKVSNVVARLDAAAIAAYPQIV